MATTTIQAGTQVVIIDADGASHEVEALSGIENKGHSFPVVWVNRPLTSGGFEPIPWPADAVRVV
jgi:plastocyanin